MDRLSPNPGITEHTTPSGLIITCYPTSHEKEWDVFGGPMNFMEARSAACLLLTPGFVSNTFSSMNLQDPATKANMSLIQQGRKNAIYLLDTSGRKFVLVMSRGTPELQMQVEKEYENLKSLHSQLQKTHLPVFVPKSYSMQQGETVSGYSFEYLPRHFELRGQALYFPEIHKYYTYFSLVSDEERARKFNDFESKNCLRWINIPEKDKKQDPNYRLKTELIARLYIIHQLTGCVPAEFIINAGDFMANPDKNDFDLRLITIRGGWKSLGNEGFVEWLMNCEYARGSLEEIMDNLKRPLFDFNPIIIRDGLARGMQIMKR